MRALQLYFPKPRNPLTVKDYVSIYGLFEYVSFITHKINNDSNTNGCVSEDTCKRFDTIMF